MKVGKNQSPSGLPFAILVSVPLDTTHQAPRLCMCMYAPGRREPGSKGSSFRVQSVLSFLMTICHGLEKYILALVHKMVKMH